MILFGHLPSTSTRQQLLDPAPIACHRRRPLMVLHGRVDGRKANLGNKMHHLFPQGVGGRHLVASSTYLKGSLSEQFHPLLQSPSCIKLKLESRWVVAQLQCVISEEYFRKLHASKNSNAAVAVGEDWVNCRICAQRWQVMQLNPDNAHRWEVFDALI